MPDDFFVLTGLFAACSLHVRHQSSRDELEHQGRRLVISYNPIMAAKDRKDRQRLLDRLGKLANADSKVTMKDVIQNNGSKKYLQLAAGEKTASIRWDKADSDAAWDGISGYLTNSTKPVGVVISNYHRLWEIEDAFRLCKHDLKMRPIFHHKGNRIRAHLDICFITYALARQLMYRYRLRQGEKCSYNKLRKALAETRFSFLHHVKSGDMYGVPRSMSPIAKNLYRLVGLRWELESGKESCGASRTPFKL